jgi:predicted lipid-binding transport protein (Tim44 family)
MKRSLVLMALIVMVFAPLLWTAEAWARAGGGSSGGSRGSRSSSPPSSSSSPSRVTTQPSPAQQPPASPRPGWGGMLGGLLFGGLIGSLLFGGLGGGLFGGVGLLELLIIGGLIWFAMSYMRRQQTAAPPGYASPDWRPGTVSSATAAMESPAGPTDLAQGLGFIRQMDPGFDSARFTETAEDIFFKIQAAWMARDLGGAAQLLTDEMRGILQRDCDRLRAEGKINRLENIAVRSAEITEAWQERGQDYVTVRLLASLLDYTTDESGAQVLEGNRTEPVKFEEYWTFVRPVGPAAWKLSAIQQL